MKKLIVLGVLAMACAIIVNAQTGIFPGPRPAPHPNPRPSGFYGQALSFGSGGPGNDQYPDQGTPIKTYVSIYDSNGLLIGRAVSNPVGQFYSYLAPGTYTLVATLHNQKLPPRLLKQYVPPDSRQTAVAQPVPITVIRWTLTKADVGFYSTGGA